MSSARTSRTGLGAWSDPVCFRAGIVTNACACRKASKQMDVVIQAVSRMQERPSATLPRFQQTQRSGEFLIKRTYQPKKRYRRRVHGFLRRMASRGGARVVQNRRRKGRQRLTP